MNLKVVWSDQLYLAYDGHSPEPERIKPVGNAYGQFMLKPSGGLWTSPLIGERDSAFIRQCVAAERVDHWLGVQSRRFVLRPKPDVRLLVLNRKSEFRALIRTDWRPSAVLRRAELNATNNLLVAKMLCDSPSPIDWTALAEHYDGIWAQEYIPPLWSCESIVWMRWCFDEVKEV